jgi:hypothetical protein
MIPKVFVKMSGNLLKNKKVVDWLRKISEKCFVAICVGGGTQINRAFKQKGFAIRFGPLGRITDSTAERQLAGIVLTKNRANVLEVLEKRGISARVIVPLDEIAGVSCPVNGDLKLLTAYNGYDQLFLFTTKKRVTQKRLWLKRVAQAFGAPQKGKLDKIKVVGF